MKKLFLMIWRVLVNADKLLSLIVVGVSALSMALLVGLASFGDVGWRSVQVQAIAIAIGIVGALVASAFDPDDLARLWKLYLPPVVLLMVMTYIWGSGPDGSDNVSWLDLGPVMVQPSEFLKIAFILTFALHLSKAREELNKPLTLLLVLAHGAAPVALIILQRDDGVALIMAGIIAAMLFVAGISHKLVLGGIGAVVLGLPIIWFKVMSEYQRMRFMVVWNPALDPQGGAYQQLKGLTALGAGQVFGNGLFSENHIRVPNNYNDFIFTFLGEAFGFVGCFFLLVALAVICGRMLQTGYLAKSYTGKFICVGVFAMFALQTAVNVSMCLMIMPVIGVTLPLVSAGGSSVLSAYAGVGLVLGVYASNNKNMFSN
ncbi:MAG: FtsW/RodA/SpoVE family cell cycle protein [Angelakisella sp.]